MAARRNAILGAVLGLGAPIGLLAVRRMITGGGRGWLRRELRDHGLFYAYGLVGTCVAFMGFGYRLGQRERRLIAGHAEVNRLRDEFAAVIAHDLRTPIQALRLQSELLLHSAQPGGDTVAVPVRSVERVHRATQELAQMVDDLLDASRIESRRLAVHPQQISLAERASEVIEATKPTLGGHPVTLVEDEPAAPVLFDSTRFSQVLANLLSNAAKYSDPGTPIEVHISGDHGGATLSVVDRGWGIASDDLPRLFDRFYQAQRARNQKSGLGLGLYIVRGLMEAQGGSIGVQSAPGRGSTFTLWFPCVAR
jgi:signal transduction histidine kinase